MSYDVNGKVVLITGANRGIGRAIAELFLSEGAAKLYAAVRNPDSAKPLAQQHGEKVVPVELDLSKPETITAAAATARDVQIVVNNAGVFRSSSAVSEDAIESIEFEMNVNVYGLIRMAQAFAPILKSNGGGAFVQLNSVASMKCFPDFATYCASKAAAYSITQALRETLGAQGTAVVSVHPGPIDTDMADSAGFGDIAEPPSLVAESIVAALRAGEFHAFPGSIATKIADAYRSFAENVVEANLVAG